MKVHSRGFPLCFVGAAGLGIRHGPVSVSQYWAGDFGFGGTAGFELLLWVMWKLRWLLWTQSINGLSWVSQHIQASGAT